ncbi:GlcG/HbpS family heme-binding protein [Kineococcus indalonis]|uniref:GlcG/HbpS family heme-binding protein n=1 Tax=Kineococcus indalonis TaxID=2696566 RepID=UPI001412F12A|nr:heme-binding protein [Kineococcus indalonis]NAZ84554.1 heme-binding protein [Kineococcus indalonis]
MTNTAARAVLEAAITAADSTGRSCAIAVVDAAGHLNAFARMDGAPVIAIQVAIDKAYTAAGFGTSTAAWHETIRDDAPLALGAPAQIDRLITFGGGEPITVGNQVIGGIGVCGGHWSEDVSIAQAGLRVLTERSPHVS